MSENKFSSLLIIKRCGTRPKVWWCWRDSDHSPLVGELNRVADWAFRGGNRPRGGEDHCSGCPVETAPEKPPMHSVNPNCCPRRTHPFGCLERRCRDLDTHLMMRTGANPNPAGSSGSWVFLRAEASLLPQGRFPDQPPQQADLTGV